jgi:hypothetical protein
MRIGGRCITVASAVIGFGRIGVMADATALDSVAQHFAGRDPVVQQTCAKRRQVELRLGQPGEVGSRLSLLALLALLALGLSGCGASGAPREPAAPVPGLGEIMTLTQMRHTKLWLAGQAQNWPLADYEVDELEEGFEDAIRFHPTHKSSPVPLAQVIPLEMDAPLAALRASIGRQDPAGFTRAFESLTAACNACHQATNFGFNVVTTPLANPFPNQVFAPAGR